MGALLKIKSKATYLALTLISVLFVGVSTGFANNVPPSPTNSFYGDATGDMIIDASDIAQAKAWTLGLPYAYDTIQPAAPTQDWNTSDITSDILIDAADLSALKSWTLGFSVTIPDKPWVLSNENLPLVGNAIATPIPFQVNLASTVGTAFGRAGIPVVVQINAAASTTTGSLVGRSCAPIAGSRDQSSIGGDQCALSVSVTDWYGAPGATKGLTETGAYGLSVIGNSGGNLRLVFSIDSYPPGLDIPAITLGVVVGFSGGNPPPTWSTAPTNITGIALGLTYVPTVDGIATDPDTGEILTCSNNGTSCTFPVVVGGSSTKPVSCTVGFTANLTAQSCNLRIVVTDTGSPAATLGSTIVITTVNNPPQFTTTAPATAKDGVLYSYTAAGTDADTGENLLCIKLPSDSCGGTLPIDTPGPKPHTCPTYTFTPGAGSQTCSVSLRVVDNGVPANYSDQITTVTINRNPIFTSSPANIAQQGSVYSYGMSANDADNPAQTLTCAKNGADTCGGILTGGPGTSPLNCNYSFTPGAAQQTCVMGLTVTDSGTPQGSVTQNTTITINRNPTFTTTPLTTAGQGLVYSYAMSATDPDSPAQTMACTRGAGDTCSGSGIVGGPSKPPLNCTYSFTPGAAQQSCVLQITVTDNKGGSTTQTQTVTINRKPTWSTAPSNITGVALGSTRAPTVDGIATDVDTPAQILTCSSGGTSCPFLPTVSGSSTSPTSCLVGFTATQTVQTCNLRIVVTDTGTPAATLGSTIMITTVNNPPTFTTTGGTTGRQGVLYSYTAGTTDADTGENLTCTLGTVNTCAGALPADTPGVKPHNCTAYTFTPGAGLQTCQFRLVVTDNGGGAATAGQTTTVTINRNPTWSTAPTNITGVALGSTRAPAVDGIATDADVPAQVLTCSSGGTSCPFTPTVTGSSVAPTSCLVGFTATLTVQTCNLRIVVTDAGAPAATLGSTITITTVNNPPTFTTTGGTTARQGVLYSYTAGTTDADTGENLTCTLGTLNTCGGALPADTPGVKPHNCTAYTFTPGAALQTCQFRLVVTDNGGGAATAGQTTTVTINRNPTWTTAPANITITGGSVYGTTNGVATDPDVPAQNLTCSSNGTSCSFAVTVSGGPSTPPRNCSISFTATIPAQTCNLRILVTDTGSPAATLGTTITITIRNHRPTWNTTPSNITISPGSVYNQTNGIAADVDTGQTLTCSSNSTTCYFAITVSGTGASPRNCNINFTAPTSYQTCNLRVMATDNGNPALTVGATIVIKNHVVVPRISGTIQFEKVPITLSGLNFAGIFNKPARRILLMSIRASDSVIVGQTFTADDGSYIVDTPPNTTVFIAFAPIMNDGLSSVDVESAAGTISMLSGPNIVVVTTDITGRNYLATDASRFSGPYNILDVILSSYIMVRASNATFLPLLEVIWKAETNSTNASYSANRINLRGVRNVDSDEFDDHVIAHEYGHHMQRNLYRSDSIGGSHSLLDKLDVRVTYGEGWADAFSGMALNDNLYLDSYGVNGSSVGGMYMETNTTAGGNPNWGYSNEWSVLNIVWDLFDSVVDAGDTLAYGYGPLNSVAADAGLNSSADLMYIYPMINTLVSQRPADQSVITTILGNVNLGYPEVVSNTFRDVTLNYSTTNVSIDGTNGSNKYDANHFYRFTTGSTLNVRVTTTCASDIDVFVYRKGVLIYQAITGSGNETVSMPSLAAGTYVVNIRTYTAAAYTYNISIATY